MANEQKLDICDEITETVDVISSIAEACGTLNLELLKVVYDGIIITLGKDE